ncbi:MAG: bifunctional metallophosphatase/5'-nucleotidase [Lutibacter sp.]|uniref:bifunctional metallophosphatase/5'-nucleotidase n=1 Tax=Lutibacter sp. TaxID=1925666 RepID=UPI0017FD25ED|nr:bifunctional UDP-sugar hydrolase/5'-nucleotidase [Lutibacter sp.]MBT8318129.1 bifunctional metallophosphatase/5'-nucleotidase [Lutibacter sp.]NNJ58989.1 bifunctional metallophosphatase/5'-nucleotidase [Lutibacter sp.]
MKYFKIFITFTLFSFLIVACSKNENDSSIASQEDLKEITIFHINDQHGKLDNFSKIKYIVDKEKEDTNVILVCGGDIFSGNPVVDNYDEKGFPMIDIMNKVGFDISTIGNHEFDYGEKILKDRFQQAQFPWICANVDMNTTGIPQPHEYKSITKNNVKITFLGLIETNGKDDDIIPSTHPWRVENLTFQKYTSVIQNYSQVKESENSDLYIALTHLGEGTDINIANNYPYFDLIIGGHSHSKTNTITNNIPIFQAGGNLNYLGKIHLTIKNKRIENLTYDLIDLSNYSNFDSNIKDRVEAFNENANLDEIIGYAESFHSKDQVGYFYTDALRNEMNVDLTFQNTGGIRSSLNEGDITKREIYTIDPFNNTSVTYTMSVSEIKQFLKNSGAGFYYSGYSIEQEGNEIILKNGNNEILNENAILTIGLNDYIPAVYDTYFTQTPTTRPYTTAETIINYLENNSNPINFTSSNNYFKFQ